MTEVVDVFEAIRSGRYENKVPYSVEIVPVDEDRMTVRQAREHKEAEKARDRAQHRLYSEEQGRMTGLFQADLEAMFGVVGNPKASKLWEIAWERGHSSGYHEVACHYQDMVDLIR